MINADRDGDIQCGTCGREHAFHALCVPASWARTGAVLPPPMVPQGRGSDALEARAVADALRSAATFVDRMAAGGGGS